MKKTGRLLAAGLTGVLLCALSFPVTAEESMSAAARGMDLMASRTLNALKYGFYEKTTAELNEQLQTSLERLLEEYQVDPESVAVDIRSLDGKFSAQVNNKLEFVAASLYKVPLAILYYDKIENGELSMDGTLPYYEHMYEAGSVIAGNYYPGSDVPIEELLTHVIVDSDNTAGHILFENMGGWEEYKEQARFLGEQDADFESYLSRDNYTTAAYMNDVMVYILSNADKYEKLIEDMRLSQPENYLNRNADYQLPQKYGALYTTVNASGFCPDGEAYVITVLTDGGAGELIIGDVSTLAYDFFHSLPEGWN